MALCGFHLCNVTSGTYVVGMDSLEHPEEGPLRCSPLSSSCLDAGSAANTLHSALVSMAKVLLIRERRGVQL